MISLNWCLIIPTVLLLIACEGVIGSTINYMHNVSTVRAYDTSIYAKFKRVWARTWPVLLMFAVLLGFFVLLALMYLFMYATGARVLFQGIDRVINSALNTAPKSLLVIYFLVPLGILYIFYCILSWVYEHNQKKEYEEKTAAQAKKEEKKISKLAQRSNKKNSRKPKADINFNDIFDPLVKEETNLNAMKFRRIINGVFDGKVQGIKYQNYYYVVVNSEKQLQSLQHQLGSLLKAPRLDEHGLVICADADDKSIQTFSKQKAVNQFRSYMNKEKGVQR